jgi:hypothetical protein
MYLDGRGVRQDTYQAKEWLGKACNNGHQKGCNVYKALDKAGY